MGAYDLPAFIAPIVGDIFSLSSRNLCFHTRTPRGGMACTTWEIAWKPVFLPITLPLGLNAPPMNPKDILEVCKTIQLYSGKCFLPLRYCWRCLTHTCRWSIELSSKGGLRAHLSIHYSRLLRKQDMQTKL